MMVPPVPTPETRMSIWPSVSFQISGRWSEVDVGVGGVLELLRQPVLLRIAGDDLLRLGDGALHALGALGQDQFRAEGLEHAPAFQRHGLGHGEDDAVAARGGQTYASAMPVLPLVGSTMACAAGVEFAVTARRPRSSPRRCGTSPSRPDCAPRSWR
ncbi:MAG: hypothetical protein QM767_28385 [Anaeromyxobacter sp.]